MPTDTKRVAVIDGGYNDYSLELAALDAIGYRLEEFDGGVHDIEGKIAFAQGADGMMVRWTEVDGVFLDALPDVRCIVRYGVGYDNINIPDATARGIPVSNVQGYGNNSVSDHATSLLYACARDLPTGIRNVADAYTHAPTESIMSIKDMTLGIIGLGRIGGTLSRRAGQLFARVIAYDPYITDADAAEKGAARVDFDTLLTESDAISCHCNLTEETRHILNDPAFAKMARCPVVVNTARGPVIDEDALLRALDDNRIRSSGIDVFAEEPPPADHPLLHHPRVLCTGHYAWFSQEADDTLKRRAGENMAAMLQGTLPDDCLNPEAWAKHANTDGQD
jgi:D-3-phosphoglycerate dehydrogenase